MKGDKQLRDKLNEQQFPFEEAAWRAFEEMRDGGEKKKDRKLLILFVIIGALALSLLGSLIFGYYHKGEMKKAIEAQNLQLAQLEENQEKVIKELETELARLQSLENKFAEKKETTNNQLNSLVSDDLDNPISSPDLPTSDIRTQTQEKSETKLISTPVERREIVNNPESKIQTTFSISSESKKPEIQEVDLMAVTDETQPVSYKYMAPIKDFLPLKGSLDYSRDQLSLSPPIIDIQQTDATKSWYAAADLAYAWHNDDFGNSAGYGLVLGKKVSNRWNIDLGYRRYNGQLVARGDDSSIVADVDGASGPNMEFDTTGLDVDPQNESFEFIPEDTRFSIQDISLGAGYVLNPDSRMNVSVGPRLFWRSYSKDYTLEDRLDPAVNVNASANSTRASGSTLGLGADVSLSYQASPKWMLRGNFGLSRFFNGHSTANSGIGVGYTF